MKSVPYRAYDRFYPHARDLRRVFDERFADPLRSHSLRFQWDYWHHAEYTLLRTPAYTYFPEKLYARFHRYLVAWGRENLGCHDISPPWLSCYVEGCRQDAHRDMPHGPLAFVYSLTPPRPRFEGGETFLTKPRLTIAPSFNRLTVFNPAIPHGVRAVRGTHDPREGRLVVHGWFVNPRPFWVGPLRVEDVRQALESDLDAPPGLRLGTGFLSLRLNVTKAGRVSAAHVLMNTLDGGRGRDVDALVGAVRDLRFPARRGPTRLTLPFTID